MSLLQTMLHWFAQSPLSATAVFFGTIIVAVTLCTYVYDYRALTEQD